MTKLALLSVIIVMMAAPLLASKVRKPKRGLRMALSAFLIFNALYIVLVLGGYLRLYLQMTPAKLAPEYFTH